MSKPNPPAFADVTLLRGSRISFTWLQWLTELLKPSSYGAFHDTTTQSIASPGTATAVTFNSTDISSEIAVGTPTSRIVVPKTAAYNFQFSAQLNKASGGSSLVHIWCAVNGTAVPNSAGRIRLAGGNSETLPSWNYVLQLNAGDYFELMWTADSVDSKIYAFPAAAPIPAIPSIILTVSDNLGG